MLVIFGKRKTKQVAEWFNLDITTTENIERPEEPRPYYLFTTYFRVFHAFSGFQKIHFGHAF